MQNVVFGSFKTFNFVLFFFYFLECKLHCFQFVRQIGLDDNDNEYYDSGGDGDDNALFDDNSGDEDDCRVFQLPR